VSEFCGTTDCPESKQKSDLNLHVFRDAFAQLKTHYARMHCLGALCPKLA